MTIGQALGRLKAEARRLRAEGAYAAAHDWQRDAADLERLWNKAAKTPTQRSK